MIVKVTQRPAQPVKVRPRLIQQPTRLRPCRSRTRHEIVDALLDDGVGEWDGDVGEVVGLDVADDGTVRLTLNQHSPMARG